MNPNIDAEAQAKFQEMQIIEQNLQSLLMQKQNNHMELSETSNALEEVKKSSDIIYKMVGSIMVVVDKNHTIKELEEKKRVLEIRSESVSKQERTMETKAREIQSEIKKLLEKSSPSANDK
ncbi:MAG: prefoldin subunit beta [Candidatus Pacearchaeota archaeon]